MRAEMLLVDETRMTRNALRYGFAVGKVRVLETRMLDRAAYERLLDAPTLAEQRRLLSETAYGRYLEHAQTAEDVESGLDEALDGFYGYLDEAALPHEVVQFFRVRYDFANLKAALKAQLFGASLEGLIVVHGTVPVDAFEGDLKELPEPLGLLADELAEETTSAVVDARTDAAMYAELGRLAKKAHSGYLMGLAKLIVDIGNVKTIVRGKHAGLEVDAIRSLLASRGTISVDELDRLVDVPLSELPAAFRRLTPLAHFPASDLNDPAELDIATDAVVTDTLREGRRGTAGPEPVIAYVFAREYEVAALRLVLLGKLTGIPTETLRTRLRASYR